MKRQHAVGRTVSEKNLPCCCALLRQYSLFKLLGYTSPIYDPPTFRAEQGTLVPALKKEKCFSSTRMDYFFVEGKRVSSSSHMRCCLSSQPRCHTFIN